MIKARYRQWAWWDENIEKVLMFVFYGYFCAIILVEVILRYVFNSSTPWGEMTARYAFVYLVSIATAEAARHNNHIRVDLLPSLLKPRSRLLLYVYFDCLHVVLGVLVIWYSLRTMNVQIVNEQMMQVLDINMAVATFALPFGWGLFVFRVVRRLRENVRTYARTGEVPLGGEGVTE